jgi:FkbM family methyltransferase
VPAALTRWPGRVRQFDLALPAVPVTLPLVTNGADHPGRRRTAGAGSLRVSAPWGLYLPRLLEQHGVAGYEPETVAAFLAAITHHGESPEVFDVGANVGIFSLLAAALTSARVTGFEPTPELAATFGSIASANRLRCRVEAMALGDSNGTARLYLSARTETSNSLAAGFREAVGTVLVPVERLDDYVARTGRVPAVLKIDTETTEPDVLRGGLRTLSAHRPWLICEVLYQKTEAALSEILGSLGYRFHHLGSGPGPEARGEISADPTYRYRDWLFTPEPLEASFLTAYRAWLDAIRAAPAVAPRPASR